MFDDSPLWAVAAHLIRPLRLPPGVDLQTLAAAGATVGEERIDPTYRVGDVAVIPISGSLRKSPSIFRCLGLTTAPTYREIADAVRAAAADRQVGAILLHVTSPGGAVFGCAECAEAVWQARQSKRVVAYAEDLAASAAYWIASQAEEVVCNRVAHVGGIGAFAVVEDTSEMWGSIGLKVHRIPSTPLKGAGLDGAPVPPEYLDHVQSEVRAIAEVFLADVMRGRGVERSRIEGWHDGLTYVGDEAVARGLVDRVEALDETLAGLVGQVGLTDELERAYQRHGSTLGFAKNNFALGPPLDTFSAKDSNSSG